MSTKALSSSSLYPIETLFPKEKYQKAGIPLVLHYLIAHESNTKKITEWAQSHIKYINYAHPDYRRLTPLAVSVIIQNKAVMTFLLQKGVDPTLPDHRGWTPLHHAAVLGDETILQMLIQKVGKEAAKQ
jgi:ankyrin repeat protein